MPTIANLKVILSARTASFGKRIAGATAKVRRFGSIARNAARSAKLFSGGLIGLAAGGGLAYLATRSVSMLDNLAKTSDKLNTTTEGLATLRHGARLAGVESRTFDMALQRLVRRVGTVNAGVKVMGPTAKVTAKLFKGLGLDAKELAKLKSDVIFRKWAEALAKVGDRTKQVAVAFKFVDSEGVAVVNMIENVTRGWSKLVTLAEELGIRFSRVQLKWVENMADAFFNLRTKMSMIVAHAVVRLSPALEVVFERLTAAIGNPAEMADKLVGGIEWVGRKILSVVNKIVRGVLHAVRVTTIALETGFKVAAMFVDRKAIDEVLGSLAAFRKGVELALSLPGGEQWYERTVRWFEDAVANVKALAAAAVRAATGIAPEPVAIEAAAARYRVQQLKPSELGGLTATGAARVNAFWGGTMEGRIQVQQLDVLRSIDTTIKRQRPPGLGK